MGSLFEIETQLIIIDELNLIKDFDSTKINDLIQIEGKMINSLINRIKSGF